MKTILDKIKSPNFEDETDKNLFIALVKFENDVFFKIEPLNVKEDEKKENYISGILYKKRENVTCTAEEAILYLLKKYKQIEVKISNHKYIITL
jgi:hypothetical protein